MGIWRGIFQLDEVLTVDLRLRTFLKVVKYISRPCLPERIDVVQAQATGARDTAATQRLTPCDSALK